MKNAAPGTTSLAPPTAPTTIEGWTVWDYPSLPSTNPVAGALSAWHAVRAAVQTAGRGRTGRAWVSNAGGLWLSANVPTPGDPTRWAILPLAAGWAVANAVRDLGAPAPRLRWPNDLLLGTRKLAGVLVERYRSDCVVIGLGLNVTNRAAEVDPELANLTVRLADLVSPPPTLDGTLRTVLRALRHVHERLLSDEFAAIAEEIDARWDKRRRVELVRVGHNAPVQGRFDGIDVQGRLRFVPDGQTHAEWLAGPQVALLRELD